jgi:hypothetical protein
MTELPEISPGVSYEALHRRIVKEAHRLGISRSRAMRIAWALFFQAIGAEPLIAREGKDERVDYWLRNPRFWSTEIMTRKEMQNVD